MDENKVNEVVEETKEVTKRKIPGKNIAILVLSILLASSITCNIAFAVSGRGHKLAMNDQKIEQFAGPGGQQSQPNGQMPGGNMQQGQPSGQMPGGQQDQQSQFKGEPEQNDKAQQGQKSDEKSSDDKTDDSSKEETGEEDKL